VDEARLENILDVESATVLWQREEYNSSLQEEAYLNNDDAIVQERRVQARMRRKKQNRLTQAICSLLDDYSMVSFVPLNIQDEESLDHVLSYVDHTIQYGEDLEVRGAEEDDFVGASEFE
jgi:hypothetical protein